MNSTLIETQARHRITERVARAAGPHLPHLPRRHRVAEGLRRFADRVDG